jgi:hypothetical protein
MRFGESLFPKYDRSTARLSLGLMFHMFIYALRLWELITVDPLHPERSVTQHTSAATFIERALVQSNHYKNPSTNLSRSTNLGRTKDSEDLNTIANRRISAGSSFCSFNTSVRRFSNLSFEFLMHQGKAVLLRDHKKDSVGCDGR